MKRARIPSSVCQLITYIAGLACADSICIQFVIFIHPSGQAFTLTWNRPCPYQIWSPSNWSCRPWNRPCPYRRRSRGCRPCYCRNWSWSPLSRPCQRKSHPWSRPCPCQRKSLSWNHPCPCQRKSLCPCRSHRAHGPKRRHLPVSVLDCGVANK